MTFKPGQSGNPGGKTGDKIITDQIRLVVNEIDPVTKVRKARRLANKLYDMAIEGEGWAFAQIMDRLEGKPAQDNKLTIEHKHAATDYTRDELVALIHDAATRGQGTAEEDGRGGESDSVH